jgi:hypothetical protein
MNIKYYLCNLSIQTVLLLYSTVSFVHPNVLKIHNKIINAFDAQSPYNNIQSDTNGRYGS